jgi:hypothetical protein
MDATLTFVDRDEKPTFRVHIPSGRQGAAAALLTPTRDRLYLAQRRQAQG